MTNEDGRPLYFVWLLRFGYYLVIVSCNLEF